MAASTTSLIFLSAHELQEKLSRGETTSVELVNLFLAQIERHNHQGLKLNAVISQIPRDIAIKAAEALDAERTEGKLRGALHGIPIIIKDVLVTGPSLGMPTSAGSAVFATLKAKKNATAVDRLIEAGAIILAKTNMTEFCGLKSNDTPLGYCAIGGQTYSAYRQDGLEEKDQAVAGGSSGGSAVGITAGFSPIAVGSETSGSAVYPAGVNGIYGMKLTVGSSSVDGCFSLSSSFDALGPMARNPRDLAVLTKVLLDETALRGMPNGGIDAALEKGFAGLSVGLTASSWGVMKISVDDKWGSKEVVSVWESAAEKMRSEGLKVVYPLDIPEADTLKHEGETLHTVAYHEFPGEIVKFISNFEPDPAVTSLKDIIAWNEKHPEKGMPEPHTTQTELVISANNTMAPEKRLTALTGLKRLAGPDGIGKVMDQQGLDVILAPSDSTLFIFAAFLGWPICAVPLARLQKNGQPYAMFATARAGREDVLLSFMEGWYHTFDAVEPPAVSEV